MKSINNLYKKANITRERRNQLNKHRSVVIWITGLSGSGKSTLAFSLEEELYKLECRTYVLDGDNIRRGLSSDLTFTDSDRKENIRRIAEVANLIVESGVIAIAALISPFKEDRILARKLLSHDDFIEIYCKASLEVCEARDVKGLYKLARAGKIENYTGIDSPYEAPENPELVIDTESETIKESVKKVVDILRSKGIIN